MRSATAAGRALPNTALEDLCQLIEAVLAQRLWNGPRGRRQRQPLVPFEGRSSTCFVRVDALVHHLELGFSAKMTADHQEFGTRRP